MNGFNSGVEITLPSGFSIVQHCTDPRVQRLLANVYRANGYRAREYSLVLVVGHK